MGFKPRRPKPGDAWLVALMPGLDRSAGAGLRRHLATSDAADLLYACGWPHLAVADPRHPDDLEPRAKAIACLDRKIGYAQWRPSRVVSVVTRARLAARYEAGERSPLEPLVGGVSDEPMTPGEGAAIVRENFFENKRGAAWGAISLWDVEALAGAAVVAEALIAALESLDDDALNEFCNHRGAQIWQLGFVLLRVEASAAAGFRRRLEAVFERARAIYPWTFDTPDGSTQGMIARRLDVVLNGAAGAERSGYRIWPGKQLDPSSMVFAVDDPDWVLAQLERWPVDDDPEDYTSFWFRPMYLAGERGIALEAGRWRRYPRPEQLAMSSMMAELASPAVVRMRSEMDQALR